MTSRSRPALVPLAAAALVLAGCASSPDSGAVQTDAPSTSPNASTEPTASTETPEPSESEAAEPAMQTVTTPDGATFEIPEDWTTTDSSTEDEFGGVIQVDVLDADGSLVLGYVHDQGGLGGLGGACETDPATEVLGEWDGGAGYETMSTDGETTLGAYAVEQQSGGVVLTMGYFEAQLLESTTCLTSNDFIAPDGLLASFASSWSGDDGPETSALDVDPMWQFGDFAEAQTFVDSDEGQTIVRVLQSLEMPAA